MPLKKYLLFEGLEFEKVLIEEVAGGRRAVACLANNAINREGRTMVKMHSESNISGIAILEL